MNQPSNVKFFFILDRLRADGAIDLELANSKSTLFWKVYNSGRTKILEFSDSHSQSGYSIDERCRVYVSVPRIGLSLIENGSHASELVYIRAENIEFLSVFTEIYEKAELTIGEIQVDNQCNYKAFYPVLMWQKKQRNESRPFIHLAYNRYLNSGNCLAFQKFQFLMQELSIQLESNLIQRLYRLHTRLLSLTVSQGQHEIFLDSKNIMPSWITENVNKNAQKFFFELLEIHPMKIYISFVPTSIELDKFEKVLKGLGMSLIRIESAPIKLNALKIEDLFGAIEEVVPNISTHYKTQITKQLFSLIGFADFLGNPIGLINNLGTGVFDVFYEPFQGAVDGPLSAGKGVLKGTGSLLKNTVEGTFGTVSKLTGSINTGLHMLTADKESIQARNVERKPTNVLQGVGMGFESLFKSIGKGVTGVVAEPIRGGNQSGFTGVLKGVAKGLGGLVTKPITGVLDVAGKTAEGIKNTPNSMIGNKSVKRTRLPRILYGHNSVIKPYNKDDNSVRNFLINTDSSLENKKFAWQCAFTNEES